MIVFVIQGIITQGMDRVTWCVLRATKLGPTSFNVCSVQMENIKPMAVTTAAQLVWIIPTTPSSQPQVSMLVSVITASIKAWTARPVMRAKLASLITKQGRASALIASQIQADRVFPPPARKLSARTYAKPQRGTK